MDKEELFRMGFAASREGFNGEFAYNHLWTDDVILKRQIERVVERIEKDPEFTSRLNHLFEEAIARVDRGKNET